MNKVEFATLEAAYWRYVDQHCPHPKESRHRYTWMRHNLRFSLNGIVYERQRSTGTGVSGQKMHVIAYRGGDGSLHEGEQEMRSVA